MKDYGQPCLPAAGLRTVNDGGRGLSDRVLGAGDEFVLDEAVEVAEQGAVARYARDEPAVALGVSDRVVRRVWRRGLKTPTYIGTHSQQHAQL